MIKYMNLPEEAERCIMSGMSYALKRDHVSSGPEIDEFEKELATHYGVSEELVVVMASCSDALECAVDLISPTDRRWLIPSVTWNATWNAVVNAINIGRMWFTPVDENGLMYVRKPEWIDDEVGEVVRTGILTVDLYGLHSTLPLWARDVQDLRLVIDAAQSFEREIDENADATCISFQALKSLPLGQGGACIFKSPTMADIARQWRWHGISTSGYKKEQYSHGRKSNMLPGLAKAGTWLLKSGFVHEQLEQRAANFRLMSNILSEHNVPHVQRDGLTRHDSCHAFVVFPESRQDFIVSMEARGVQCVPYYPSFADHRFFGSGVDTLEMLTDTDDEVEHVKTFGRRATAVPCHTGMEQDEVERVAQIIQEYCESARA